MSLVVHPSTQHLIALLRADLPQSVLLSGEEGIGLLTVAREIASKHLAAELYPADVKGNRDGDNGTISVEMIRRLYEQTRAKYTEQQVIIIDNADRMSHGAQSAFLKLLEEPNASIHFILTSHRPQKLLATIHSRVEAHTLAVVTPEQTDELLTRLAIADPTKLAQLRFIAAGLPAEIVRLSADETYFRTKVEVMGDARSLLQGHVYERLLIVQKYQGSREQALRLIDSAMQIARRSLSSQPQQSLVRQLDYLLGARERIANNHNIRLQLAAAVL